jgi:hypothetical protein
MISKQTPLWLSHSRSVLSSDHESNLPRTPVGEDWTPHGLHLLSRLARGRQQNSWSAGGDEARFFSYKDEPDVTQPIWCTGQVR